ncbi:MAG: dirigent protein [Actinomycetota bacterium]|nr:dirigent protein [Actinomycetota bacterium]
MRNAPKAPRPASLQGDVFAFTNPLTDDAGARVGTLHAHCVTTVGARDFRRSTLTCTVTLHLRDGDLMGQTDLRPMSDTVTGAVTGGTGAYANARGVVVSKAGRSGSTDTITLVG